MSRQQNTVVVPWINSTEFEEVYNGLFNGNIEAQKYAVERIYVWKSRCFVPVAIESTGALFRVAISSIETKDMCASKVDDLRNAYSLAIIRFVNHITEKAQVKMYMQPVHRIAEELGVPEWIVNLRHDATHRKLPALDLLKTAADCCIQWLKEEFWDKQIEGIASQEPITEGKTISDEVDALLTNYINLKLKETGSPKKKVNKRALPNLLYKLEMAVAQNRDNAVTCLVKYIEADIKDNTDTESVLTLWDPVLHIYQQYGLSLSLLKHIPLSNENHGMISSLLYQFTSTVQDDLVMKYLDFLLNQPDQYHTISLLQKLDLHHLLPENKANQLTNLLSCHWSDKNIVGDKVFYLKDLKIDNNQELISPWQKCSDNVSWNQFPIGSLPGCLLTYDNLTLGKTKDSIHDIVNDTELEVDMECTEVPDYTETLVQKIWSNEDLDRIQSLVHIL